MHQIYIYVYVSTYCKKNKDEGRDGHLNIFYEKKVTNRIRNKNL